MTDAALAELAAAHGIATEFEDWRDRTVDVPDDLASALDAAGVRTAFDALSPSARKAHVLSVEGTGVAETRARRVAKIVAGLGGAG